MEIEKILAEIKTQDENLAKRLEPLEAALVGYAEQETAIAEQKAQTEALQKALGDTQSAMDDMKKLIRATNDLVYEPAGPYHGSWPTREYAKRIGHYFLAKCANFGPSHAYLESVGIKALAEGVTSTGSAVVPEEFIPNLINLIETHGKFRQNAQVVPMGSDTSTWPQILTDITGYGPGEGGSITASNPTFGNVSLVAIKFAALCAISSEVAEDAAVAIGEIVGSSIARTFAKMEDQAGFLGDGTSTYWKLTGIAGAVRAVDASIGSIAGVTVGTGNAYSELTLVDFDSVVGNLPSDFESNAKWYMNKKVFWSVLVPLAHGYSSSIPTIGSASEIYEGPNGTFIFRGYPVEFVSVMPSATANSQHVVTFGDLRAGCFLGDRRAIQIDQDKSVYFASDQIGIRGTERVAINAYGVGDTSDPGPITALYMAAS